jgi:hypothetical protein
MSIRQNVLDRGDWTVIPEDTIATIEAFNGDLGQSKWRSGTPASKAAVMKGDLTCTVRPLGDLARAMHDPPDCM